MKNMIFGRAMGIICLFVAIVFGILGAAVMLDTGSIFGFFMIVPPFLTLGIAMIIFPGAEETLGEVNGDISFMELLKDRKKRDERQARQLICLGKAPLHHKIVWGVFFSVGILSMIAFLIKFTA